MTHTGGIDERARLEAIVFGRSAATEAERAAATSALRALLAPAAAPPEPVAATPEPEPLPWTPLDAPASRLPRLPGRVAALLAGAALGAAVALTPVPAPFVDSLLVFDRPQSAAGAQAAALRLNLPGAGPDVDPATVRVVPEAFPEIEVLAYRTVDGDVCLAVMFADGGGGSCATEDDFRARGLRGGTLFPPSGWTYTWGPRGDPRISPPGD